MAAKNRWLLLIHQIPRTPSYLRVKVWRRLQRLGALQIKNSVYAMAAGEQALEDLVWVVREIEQGGGEASICEASFVHGLSDEQVEAAFRAARDADYRAIAADARRIGADLGRKDAAMPGLADEIERLKRRLAETTAIDFFKAASRSEALTSVGRLERGDKENKRRSVPAARDLKGKTWVTRRDVYVDRMASAWLIRRFIDPSARFKFVPSKKYEPRRGEIRFDMFGGEFTHEGDRCTFEVLSERAGLDDPALAPIGEIVHDIDLKDSKFERPETAGIERVLQGIALALDNDKGRLERSAPIFDGLYQLLGKKRKR
ncbi:MAG TPA: chromate resistance protein ChrB domain-containing protein [Candidatus Eremiobacteraceae bacterium]|nr:chromate resistance protein ChrB domain-containing protein [Candidatus Eremiobacteraceae bacterium]